MRSSATRRPPRCSSPGSSRSGPSGCRSDTSYYATAFNRPSVTARLDLKRTPVEEVTPDSIEDQCRASPAGRHRLRHRVRRAHRPRLRQSASIPRFAQQARAVEDSSVAGGPARLPGPGRARVPQPVHHHRPWQPSVLSNMPVSIEQHVEWIGDCLEPPARARADADRGDRPGGGRLDRARAAGGRDHAAPEGRVLVHGSQRPWQAPGLPRLPRRRRPLPGALRRGGRMRLRGLHPVRNQRRERRPWRSTRRRPRLLEQLAASGAPPLHG